MRVRHVMRLDLRALPAGWAATPGPSGVAFEGPGRRASELVEAFVTAYPPSHPDHVPGWDPEAEEARILDGRECGPLLPCTRFAVAGSGEDARVVGAVLVTRADNPLDDVEGAVVADLFRHAAPEWRGLGAALLRRACAAAAEAGLPSMSLFVTIGNPALALYRATGFEIVTTLAFAS